jgi:AcrR family transcriptional regulator
MKAAAPKTTSRRRYESPLRRQRAVQTKERIVEAGCSILGASSIRDWRGLTIRGVADKAGVNERTVYRYFGNERGLRDAVMHRLEEKAGIELEGMQLDDVAGIASRILTHVSSYPTQAKPPLDPTLTDAHLRQRTALLGALHDRTAGWPDADRHTVGALLDVLWSVASYQRLVSDWAMDRDAAIRALTWVIGLVRRAVEDGERPR